MKPRYHINVFYSEEDRCYIDDIPDLKYCSAHSETPKDALREVLIAQEAWLDSAKAAQKRAPEPKYRLVVYALT